MNLRNVRSIVLTASVWFLLASSSARGLETDQWIQDTEIYENQLRELHIDPFSTISEQEFDQEIDELKSNLAGKSDSEVILELMRLTRRIGDGHTAIRLGGLHRFPIEVYFIDDEWKVVKVHEDYAHLLGTTIIRIDDQPISDVAAAVAQVAQNIENAYSEEIRVGESIIVAEILFTLGVTRQDGVATFSYSDGSKDSQVTLRAIEEGFFFGSDDFVGFETLEPVITRRSRAGADDVWFGELEGTDAVYVRFASYPSFEDMETFAEELLTHIDSNEIARLVIDFRGNGGGDFFVGLTLAYYLNLADSIDWRSGVYVLTDKYTFSAGVSNAAQYRQILNARIVGEPTGGNPVGYQDMGSFILPNSS